MKDKNYSFYRKEDLNLKENFFKKGKGKQLVYFTEDGKFTYGRHKVNYFLKAKFGEPCHVDEYTCTNKKNYGCTAKIFERVKDGKKLGLFCLEGNHYCNEKKEEIPEPTTKIVNINVNGNEINPTTYTFISTPVVSGTKRLKTENGEMLVQNMIIKSNPSKIIGNKRKISEEYDFGEPNYSDYMGNQEDFFEKTSYRTNSIYGVEKNENTDIEQLKNLVRKLRKELNHKESIIKSQREVVEQQAAMIDKLTCQVKKENNSVISEPGIKQELNDTTGFTEGDFHHFPEEEFMNSVDFGSFEDEDNMFFAWSEQN